jgi:alpha-L-rhamnosidase
LDVSVPVGTTATVFIPSAQTSQVLESDRPALQSPGVALVQEGEGAAVFQIGSGTYHFSSPK